MSNADRDPVAEQDEAARAFEARTGRRSTDPAPPSVMHLRMTPTAVFGRFPGGTDPRAALGEVWREMFPTGEIIGEPDPHADAIDVESWEILDSEQRQVSG